MRSLALASDYDGTIAHHGRVDDEMLAALSRVRASGRKAILVSGRELEDLQTTFSHLELFDLAVLEKETQEEADLLPGGSVHSLVWGRDTSLANVTAFLQKVDADLLITGHIPCDQGFEVPNERQIILDSLGTPA